MTVGTGDGAFTVGGMAKGAGMLAPALATMLVVITTDAQVDAVDCDRALRAATRSTFDRLDSDGCMSTNDTVLLMSSGAGPVPDQAAFADAVRDVCHDLAQQLLADAEGSEHEIAIEVRGAASEADAVEVARAIARSALFKTAVFGQDPNWGRILASVGTTLGSVRPGRPRRRPQRRVGLPRQRPRRAARGRRPVRASRRRGRRPQVRHRERHRLDQRPDARVRARELGVLHMRAAR